MIQSLNRLFVFQRVTPTLYHSTLVCVHWAFMLVLSLWMSQEGWLQDCELSNLLHDCTQQDISRSLCWAVSCQRVHTFVDSLISISIDWFQSPTLHLRSTSCFFSALFELRRRGFFFFFPLSVFTCASSIFYSQRSLATAEWYTYDMKSCKQASHLLLNVAFLLFGKNALTVTAGNFVSAVSVSC